MNSFKIRIFEPSVPEYRVALFEGLANKYGDRIQLWSAPLTSAGTPSFPVENMFYDYSHPLLKFGPFHWQKGLSLNGLIKGDVIVVNGEIKGLSNLFYAVFAKLRGIRVIWWGHHWSSTSKMWKVLLRLQVVKLLIDVYLCYTVSGIEFLKHHGFSNKLVFATGNTINQLPIKKSLEYWNEEKLLDFKFKKSLSDKNLLLVCGVLREKMRLHQLFAAIGAQQLNNKNILVAVIGDGPEKERYLDAARKYNVNDKIIWLGAIRDENVMAPWFLSAKAYIYPGAIGLGILHSFSYGLPVITHDNAKHQMPEFEVMENEKTGLTFEENSIGDLSYKIGWLLSHEKERNEMSEYVRNLAFSKYSMDNMVANFVEAIEAAVK